MHILLFTLYTLLFAGLIIHWKFFRIDGIKRSYLVAVFAIKLMAGFGLAYLYTDHYTNRRTGDAFRFYDDATILYSSLEKSPNIYLKLLTGIGMWEDPAAMTYYWRMTHMEREFYTGFINDNATIIRANAIVLLFSFGHYHVHTVFWCFFAMIGLTALFHLLASYFPRIKNALFFAVFCLPTVLFWSSGVLKESLLLMGMGLFLLGFFRYVYGQSRWPDWAIAILGFLILLFTKGYVLQCMAPALVGLLLVKYSGGRHFWKWFALPHLLMVFLLYIGPLISDGFKIAELISLKQTAFYNIAEQSNSGSTINIPAINSASDVLKSAPQALINTYLRPWPWEWTQVLYIPAALENLFLIVCILLMLWNFRKPFGLQLPILAFSGSFIIVLGVLTGETVPILGALVRYKLPSLIFLFVLIFALTDPILLQKRFPFLRNPVKKYE